MCLYVYEGETIVKSIKYREIQLKQSQLVSVIVFWNGIKFSNLSSEMLMVILTQSNMLKNTCAGFSEI